MDPERQPLLAPTVSQITMKKFQPLDYNAVLDYQHDVSWRRARLCLMLVFWATMAIMLSIIASMLMHHTCLQDLGPAPSVPPVHMSFAPLVH